MNKNILTVSNIQSILQREINFEDIENGTCGIRMGKSAFLIYKLSCAGSFNPNLSLPINYLGVEIEEFEFEHPETIEIYLKKPKNG